MEICLIFLALIFSNTFAEKSTSLPPENEMTSLSEEVFDKDMICTYEGMAPTEVEDFASYPKIKTWKNCAWMCKLFENCEAWSHTKLENLCRLFSNFISFEANKLVVSGIKYCNETKDSIKSHEIENRGVKQVEVAVEVFNAIVNALKNEAGRTIALPSGQRFILKSNCWQVHKRIN